MLLSRSVYSRALLILMLSLAGPLTLPARAQDETTEDQTIDGAKVPKGVTKAFVKKGKKFAEDMINNYKTYLQLNETAKQKKQKGEALSKEETEVDAIKTYGEMDDWVTKQKEKIGYKVTTAGTTDAFGNVEKKTPKPKTPDEEFEDELTVNVHEPSHVEGNKKRAAKAGLTWEEVQRIGKISEKARKGEALTNDELDFVRKVKDKYKKYLELCDDPVDGALEEIGEYEAENKVREKVLDQLRGPVDGIPKKPTDSQNASFGGNKVFFVGTVSVDDEVLTTVRGPKVEELNQITIEGMVEETGKRVRESANEQGRSIINIAELAAGITVPTIAIIRALDSSGKEVDRTTTEILPTRAPPGNSPPQVTRWNANLKPGSTFTLEGRNFGTNTQITCNGVPQEVLSASSTQAVGYLKPNTPTGPTDLRVKNEWGESERLPANTYDFAFQAPRNSIKKNESLPITFSYKDLPAGTPVEITNQTRETITVRSETRGVRQTGETFSAELSGTGAINLVARGINAGNFALSSVLDLAFTNQNFGFTNDTGKDVNDLHLEFSDAVTVSDAGAFTGKPKNATNTIDLKGGSVKDGDSITITTNSKAKNPVWIRAWYWTKDGDFIGCLTLSFENPGGPADSFKLKFNQPVEVKSFEPIENGQNQPIESSMSSGNEFTLSKLKGLPKGGKVTITVCYPSDSKGQKGPPKFGQPSWK